MGSDNPAVSLPFERALNLSFHDQKLLVFTESRMALFEKNEASDWKCIPIPIPINRNIKTAIFHDSKVVMGFEKCIIRRLEGVIVGAIYDINTQATHPLLNHHNLAGSYTLNQLMRCGNHFGGVSHRLNQWDNNGGMSTTSGHLEKLNQTPIHSFRSVGDHILLSNRDGIVIFSPFDKKNIRWIQMKRFKDNLDWIVCVEPTGKFLTVVSTDRDRKNGLLRRIQHITVFNLLQTPETPAEAGPAPHVDLFESKEDD